MKLLLLAIPLSLMATSAFAGTVSLRSASASYRIERISKELPQSLQEQVLASNMKAKDMAVQQAVQKLESLCIDKNWPAAEQLDITSVNVELVHSLQAEGVYIVNVEAICRSRN